MDLCKLMVCDAEPDLNRSAVVVELRLLASSNSIISGENPRSSNRLRIISRRRGGVLWTRSKGVDSERWSARGLDESGTVEGCRLTSLIREGTMAVSATAGRLVQCPLSPSQFCSSTVVLVRRAGRRNPGALSSSTKKHSPPLHWVAASS
ncbi:hypothetical protein OUZ56_018624 [Daphnia magna]|uniref:Uncharacterized protein n=1 Tax=Daphnia magna TaxID=35525 RepID=A0ABQ9Z9B7_9CRUS|nr:hypothetical protein OUZ56_018624 [Daphnia magna]